jgi:hypothetical protein
MNLNERFNILVQGVELTLKKGLLTLDEAVEAKNHINTVQKGENLKESLGALVNMCEEAQKKGVFTLHDAYVVFMATDGIEKEIDDFMAGTNGDATGKENLPGEENLQGPSADELRQAADNGAESDGSESPRRGRRKKLK